MNYADISVFIISLLFSAYGLMCSMQAAAAFSIIKDNNNLAPRYLLSPAWELADILPVFGAALAAIFFNNGSLLIRHQLGPVLLVGGAAIVTKAIMVLLLAGTKISKDTAAGVILAANTLLILSIAAGLGQLLTSQHFYESLYGWAILVSGFFGFIALLALYAQKQYKTTTMAITEISFSVWMLVLGCLLPLAAIHGRYLYNKIFIAVVAALALSGLCLQLLKLIYKSRRSLWPLAVIVGLSAGPLLLMSNRPFLINPRLTLSVAYGSHNHPVAGPLILMAITIILLSYFWMLASQKYSSGPSK